jgi:hypothetical protein
LRDGGHTSLIELANLRRTGPEVEVGATGQTEMENEYRTDERGAEPGPPTR